MHPKNNTLALHATLARAIKQAKRRMFKRHREGMPIREAADKFCVEMAARFHEVVPDHETPLTPTEFAATVVTDPTKLPLLDNSPELIEKALRESSGGTASPDSQADSFETETRHTPDILTDEQVDYAIFKMVELSRCGPNSCMAALIRHFRDLAATGRADVAMDDATKFLRSLAVDGFDVTSRAQFLEDIELDIGSNK